MFKLCENDYPMNNYLLRQSFKSFLNRIILETYGVKLDSNVDIRNSILAKQPDANVWILDFHHNVDKEHSFLSIMGCIINMLGGKL